MPAVIETGTHQVNGQEIAYTRRGNGPPLLLLHGFPQSKEMWEESAPLLAREFTVVSADLRGYGASSKPGSLEAMSFRNMAADQLALMQALGFPRFHLAGHDRGGRTAHRLALDAPEAVASLTLMDIIPTHLLLDQLTQQVARAYYHWFFLAQPAPLPERMIGADPQAYFESCLLGWGGASLSDFPPAALAAYRRAWADPACVHAMCNDYRAAIEVDFHDDARNLDRQIHCPSLVLYGADSAMARAYDVAAAWEPHLQDMSARSVPGGHFFIDSTPAETAAALLEFLTPLLPA
ncbi:alpha/beta fold hydrolase [Leisingera sp. ANG-M7]|uniref:alpha/beta fold hydrolase n=1 Tax=Leisingera sp. ANG-M7 TaxID=1577902 RepID=UPI00057D64BC|nr:alpha/beta hydrolase [Leisingera sp. ANG-M7]KIC39339.1 alpha/beta hydrolase [Leisingera sp. ANG-M7]